MDKHILKIFFYVAVVYLLFRIADVIFLFYISVLLSLALSPVVNRLQKMHFPRGLAVLTTYLLIFSTLSLIIAFITPPLVVQTRHLIEILPPAISQVDLLVNYQQEIIAQIFSRISTLPQAVLNITVSLFSNLITVFTALVLTFYLLIQRQSFAKFIENLPFLHGHHLYSQMLEKIENRLGHWFFGELALMFSVGTLTYLGLKILGIPSALPLAIIAGLLEIIPNIGPTVSAIPSVLVAMLIHPILGISTAALYFIVQFIENNLLVPNIMQKAVGINPVMSIVGLMIGFKLGGPLGAVLAIPTIITIETVYLELTKKQ